MVGCCNLEVDVNGEEIFIVDKQILASCSGRLRKLFSKSTGMTRNLKVIFHGFPGGAEGFQLIARFCYNNRRTEITPFNVFLLYCAAKFMQMNTDSSVIPNLVEQTEKYLGGIYFWTWSELLVGLKQCQNLLLFLNSSITLKELLDSLVGRLCTPKITSPPCTSSSNCSTSQFSSEISSDSVRNYYSQPTWWFQDLVFLNIDLLQEVIKEMISQKLDDSMICSFIFYYQKKRFLTASPADKRKITEMVINLLFLLDGGTISCRGLFDIFRVSRSLKMSKCYKNKLENLIGSRLDQATVDDLLVPPSRRKKHYMYDVNLILRFQKLFLLESGSQFFLYRLKQVAGLMDLYIAEVAPDPRLKPSKFVALATALPDFARDSYDGIYQAMDMYLEVHGGLSYEEKMKICCALKYDKLSPATLKDLAQNSKFPSGTAFTAISSLQSKIKSLLCDTLHFKTFSDSTICYSKNGSRSKKQDDGQIHVHAEKLDVPTENEEQLGSRTQGMQRKMVELEKVGKKMQPQMADIMKSRPLSLSNTRALPRLCP
ncbi:hypothetical protein F0562_018948 [Nyssa sinensis]|uniref:NPH3 domain-containing protein n=1 Tax=Nyssa sinensis TaxID=561372 RepID=A0A5J4ZDR6_9ASTE|nr:hypothetical protein F0562_018948 [Nyssa sinensis]